MRGEPMSETVRREVVLGPIGSEIVKPYPRCVFQDHRVYSVAFEALAVFPNEERRGRRTESYALTEPAFEQSSCLIIEVHRSIATFLELFPLQRDGLVNPVDVCNVHGNELSSPHSCFCEEREYRLVTGIQDRIDEQAHLFYRDELSRGFRICILS